MVSELHFAFFFVHRFKIYGKKGTFEIYDTKSKVNLFSENCNLILFNFLKIELILTLKFEIF